MKKIFFYLFLSLSFLFIIGCETNTTTPPVTNPTIFTPNNLHISNNTLYWNTNTNIKEYIVEVTINNNVTTHTAINNFAFEHLLDSTFETLSFRVKSSSKDTNFSEDSNYSESLTYKNPLYINKEEIEIEILKTSFVSASSAPSGWKYNYNATLYADNSLKFANSKESITSPSFNALTTFKVEAKILGKNASGDAKISFYGLDSKGSVIETVTVDGPISNSINTISATFTNTDIKKIKFEYTTKALGNFGLFEIHIFHLENDEIKSITPINLTTTYLINQKFDYKGSFDIKYISGKTETINLIDIKNQLKISNFSTSKFDKETMSITYENQTIKLDYIVTYDYPSLISSVPTSNIIVMDNIVYISVDDIDIIINQKPSINLSDIINTLNINSLEYYICETDTTLEKDVYISLDDDNNYIYNISPTATLTYTPNGILFTNYTSDILINTTNEIDDSIIKEYDYIITKYSTNITKSNNIIFNNTSTIDDYLNFNEIYKTYSATAIYDTSINSTIELEITTCDEFLQNEYTEVSSLSTWDNEYHYIKNDYLYNHEEYYTSIYNLSEDALKNALTELITSTHTNPVNYNFARDIYTTIEPDLDNPGNIILFYSGKSINGVWDNGNTWNREHIWPKSLSGGLYPSVSGTTISAGSDLHQLRPASTSINSSRKNKPYGDITNDTYFEPRDEIKGDIARILFYMSIRYNMDIEAHGVVSSLDLLLTWHENDPVDFYEMYRNEQIQKIQGNFNPFIDNPWLVDLIF